MGELGSSRPMTKTTHAPDSQTNINIHLTVDKGDEIHGRAGCVPAADVTQAAREALLVLANSRESSMRNEKQPTEEFWLYDPGYTNIATCRSRITFIDGDRGVLEYRGYPIESLAAKRSFVDVAHVLLFDRFPRNRMESDAMLQQLAPNELPMQLKQLIASFDRQAHPMSVLMSAVASVTAFHPEWNPSLVEGDGGSLRMAYGTIEKRHQVAIYAIRMVASIAVAVLKHKRGAEPIARDVHLEEDHHHHQGFDRWRHGQDRAWTFGLAFLDAVAGTGQIPTCQSTSFSTMADALDTIFILHADHELNCSTAAMRHLTSAGTDVFSCLAGSIAALYGPLHGGATEAVLKMLMEIGDAANIDAYLDSVKKQERKLMGFGHRIYRNYDPRAKLVRDLAKRVLEQRNTHLSSGVTHADPSTTDPLLDVAQKLEQRALRDPYFVSRRLYPNVDFYSGVVYRAIGFPTEFFPVLFATARCVGWLAHWLEMLEEDEHAPNRKIVRPRQIYVGERHRSVPCKDTESQALVNRHARL